MWSSNLKIARKMEQDNRLVSMHTSYADSLRLVKTTSPILIGFVEFGVVI